MASTRRSFIHSAGVAALGASVSITRGAPAPWYARCYRWAQISLTETDASRDDTALWREQWKKTAAQGVVIDAGGVAAYYPSKLPLHRPVGLLGGRDLFGGLNEAAHREGLVVLASVDSASFGEEALKSHPDWAARTQEGQPVRAGGEYAPCINSRYIEELVHPILQEVVQRYRPEGIAGRNWEGLSRDTICQCENCAKRFREQNGKTLPKTVDWKDPAYRDWVRWSYARRLEIWDLNNKITKAAGGPDCLWVGVNAAALASQSRSFRQTREIATRTPLMLVDNLSRQDGGGFWQNTEDGRYVNGLVGWNGVIAQSAAMYQRVNGDATLASTPSAEGRLWMLSGIAGGSHPKYDHIGAGLQDRRMYETPAPVMQWHKKNERYLINRKPVAAVGVVWSQSSYDFYGRDAARVLAEHPYRGMLRACYRHRIPCAPIDIDNVEREAENLTALVLPNIGSMSDKQCAAVSRFVERGGGLIATGVTSLYDGDGEARADFGLASVLGAHLRGPAPDRMFAMNPLPASGDTAGRGGRVGGFQLGGPGPASVHSYLRLQPEVGAAVFGPHIANEPKVSGVRHPALAGFEEADILPFGGALVPFRADPGRSVLCTYVPPFPQMPTDAVWMRQERTDIPGLIVGAFGKGKVAFLPADLDRRYGMDPIPDHGRLLGNLLRWIGEERVPVVVEGTGTVGVYLYRQEKRLILHIVNATGADNQSAPIDEYSSVGPFKVTVRLPSGVKVQSVKLLVSERSLPFKAEQSVAFEIPQVADHEVAVIE